MSWIILKIGELDLDHQGQIGLQSSKIFVLSFKNLPLSNFTFQFELFIHLNVLDGFENWLP